MTTVTDTILGSPTSSFLPSASAQPASAAAAKAHEAGIIAGAVIGYVILCLLVIAVTLYVLRRRRKKLEAEANEMTGSLHRRSGSEGTSPLLMQTSTGHGFLNTRDGHRRTSSDATPFIQRESGHDSEGDTYTKFSNNTTRNISSPMPLKSSIHREPSTTNPESIYSLYIQPSTSAPTSQDFEDSSYLPSRPPPVPQIQLSEPSSNTSELVMAERSLRGTRRPLRTVLPNAPMRPLMEHVGPSSSMDANDQEHDGRRWSSAADPGGSRGLRAPESHPYSLYPSPPSTPRRSSVGFGLGLLTSAFRKSVSVSSPTTSTEFSNSQLSHYPSLVSMGATSGTGSRTETYYTALSDAGVEWGESGVSDLPTVVGMGMVNASRPKTMGSRSRSPSLRDSLSAYAYPGSSRLPNVIPGQNPQPPPAAPLPPLPVIHAPPQNQTPDPSRDSRARAHISPPSAHRVRADPHPQPSIARAGKSTHGVIGLARQ